MARAASDTSQSQGAAIPEPVAARSVSFATSRVTGCTGGSCLDLRPRLAVISASGCGRRVHARPYR
ncbi:MAG: hypothetical protein WCH74_12190, partial [Chloroflexota bacterium]